MSKTTQPSATVTTTAVAEMKPQTIHLIGPTLRVLAQVSAHVRQGYVVDVDAPVDLFNGSGNLALFLKLGDPSAQFIQAAKEATDEAMMRQQAQDERDLEERATQLVADRERAAQRAVMAGKVAEAEAALAALKAAAAA